VNLLSDDVVFAGFDLPGFGAVAGGLIAQSEHGAAGRKTDCDGGQREQEREVFHGIWVV
jgi:hypothetical protein